MSDPHTESRIAALSIDLDRLRADMEAVNALGRVDGLPGINRISFSDADMAGRRWLMGRLEEAGLAAHMDAAGNVFGRWAAGSGPAVLAGSHLDTVPQGGQFDGSLGVCAALEAVRTMKDAGIAPARPVEIVCTADEEGRFGGMFGSQAICSEVGPDWIEAAIDDTGVKLAEAMRGQGLDPSQVAPRNMDDVAAFLEIHVEQGPVLEQAGLPVGIVNAVSGVFNWSVTLTGEANHSGTTPMELRRDAFRGLADFGAVIARIIDETGGPETRLTVGKVDLLPNFPHSIAGQAVFSLIGRDIDEARMKRLAGACEAAILNAAQHHGLTVEIAHQSWLPPTELDPSLRNRLQQIARASDLPCQIMPSGAGHDAQTFARHCPAGLIFVPSIGGISHSPEEMTSWEDIEKGVNLLTRAIAALATE